MDYDDVQRPSFSSRLARSWQYVTGKPKESLETALYVASTGAFVACAGIGSGFAPWLFAPFTMIRAGRPSARPTHENGNQSFDKNIRKAEIGVGLFSLAAGAYALGAETNADALEAYRRGIELLTLGAGLTTDGIANSIAVLDEDYA